MQIALVAGLATLLVVVAMVAARNDRPSAPAETTATTTPVGAGSGPAETVRRITGLPNVETIVFALDAVWAVTSNRADRFSQEPLDAGVVRIDPVTFITETVLDSLTVEPTLSPLDDRIWVNMADRMVALNGDGEQVASVSFAPAELGGHTAGSDHLWFVDFDGGRTSAVDPHTNTIIKSVDTGAFPVRPISAFGHVWIPSVIDGTVTIVDEASLGETTQIAPFVSSNQLTDVTAVADGRTGDEVWVTDLEGQLYAIGADDHSFGEVRRVNLDVAINRIHVHRDRAILVPTWGRAILILDLETERVLARILTEAIPIHAIVAHELVWVTGDGPQEILTVIDPYSFDVRRQIALGTNESLTNGPHKPVAIGDDIWVPNRGDDAIFVVDAKAAD